MSENRYRNPAHQSDVQGWGDGTHSTMQQAADSHTARVDRPPADVPPDQNIADARRAIMSWVATQQWKEDEARARIEGVLTAFYGRTVRTWGDVDLHFAYALMLLQAATGQAVLLAPSK